MEYGPYMCAVGRSHQIIVIGQEIQIVAFHGTFVFQLKNHIDLRPLRPVDIDLRAGVIAARGQRQRLDQLQTRFFAQRRVRRLPRGCLRRNGVGVAFQRRVDGGVVAIEVLHHDAVRLFPLGQLKIGCFVNR